MRQSGYCSRCITSSQHTPTTSLPIPLSFPGLDLAQRPSHSVCVCQAALCSAVSSGKALEWTERAGRRCHTTNNMSDSANKACKRLGAGPLKTC
jgi:hypothetical protein